MSSKYSLQFRESYYSQFSIPEHLTAELKVYKYLQMPVRKFLDHWYENAGTYAAGTLRRYNHIHHVQFCKGVSIGRLKVMLAKNPEMQLRLSFRKAVGMPAFVLVDLLGIDKVESAQMEINLENENV